MAVEYTVEKDTEPSKRAQSKGKITCDLDTKQETIHFISELLESPTTLDFSKSLCFASSKPQ